jgi:hypothetical protein
MPDFNQMPDLTESDFEIENPGLQIDEKFDGPLSGWRESSEGLTVTQSDGWAGIYLPEGKNESLLLEKEIEPGSRFHLQADGKVLAPQVWGGVVFNYRSPSDYYVFRFCSGSVRAQFIHYINQSPRVLLSLKSETPLAVDRSYRLEVFAMPGEPCGGGVYLFKSSIRTQRQRCFKELGSISEEEHRAARQAVISAHRLLSRFSDMTHSR